MSILEDPSNISPDLVFNMPHVNQHIDGLVQDCSNSIANALELLQSCTKLLISCSL